MSVAIEVDRANDSGAFPSTTKFLLYGLVSISAFLAVVPNLKKLSGGQGPESALIWDDTNEGRQYRGRALLPDYIDSDKDLEIDSKWKRFRTESAAITDDFGTVSHEEDVIHPVLSPAPDEIDVIHDKSKPSSKKRATKKGLTVTALHSNNDSEEYDVYED